MIKLKLLLTVCISLAAAGATAGVYKTVDADGMVTYTDRPDDVSASVELAVRSQRTDNQRITATKQSDAEARALARDAESKSAAEAAEKSEDDARLAENCRRATDALTRLNNAQRLYVPTENGERRFLSDDEKTQRIDKAKADVAQWCNQ